MLKSFAACWLLTLSFSALGCECDHGVDGKLMANLMVQGGNIQTVRVGDKVGGWDIKSISIDSLTMSRGKETKRLSFGSYVQTPQPAAPQGPQVPGMVPGMPFPR